MVGCCRRGSALSPPTTVVTMMVTVVVAAVTMVAAAVTMAALAASQPTMVDRTVCVIGILVSRFLTGHNGQV